MKQSCHRLPCVSILFLLLVGACAAALAYWFMDHRQAVSNPAVIIAALMGTFFVFSTWALFRLLRWRDTRRAIVTVSTQVQPDPNLEGTVYGMLPDREYRIVKSFTDHYGNEFERGERLRFKQRHFLPYHGGHTIVFEGKTLYLQEDQNSEILDNFSEYIALVK